MLGASVILRPSSNTINQSVLEKSISRIIILLCSLNQTCRYLTEEKADAGANIMTYMLYLSNSLPPLILERDSKIHSLDCCVISAA